MVPSQRVTVPVTSSTGSRSGRAGAVVLYVHPSPAPRPGTLLEPATGRRHVDSAAADLFGATDVTIAWQYNRATRAWDRSYLPTLGRGGFAVEPGDVLWVVAPRAQTVGG